MNERKNRNRGYMGLRVRQDAQDFYCETYKVFGGKPRELSRIIHQAIGSSDSVHRNIAEGYCRRSKKEYLNFLNVALGSLGESVSGLQAYRRAGQISPDEFERFDSMRGNPYSGVQYRNTAAPQYRNARSPHRRIALRAALLLSLLATARVFGWDGFSSTGYSYGAAAYLDRAAHAQSAALGKAVSAWCEGLAGVQYNPALLDAARGVQMVGSYEFLKDDRRLIAVEGAFPAGQYAVVGASFRTFGVDGIEQRDEYGYLDGSFDDRENAVQMSVAGRFAYNISGGARVRYLNQLYKGLKGISDGQAHGMGFDIGAVWQPESHVCVGVSGLNVGSYLWWATGQRDIVLPQARLGVCGLFLGRTLIAELDAARTLRQPLEVSLGAQYTLFGIISARAGASTSVDIKNRHTRDPDISLGAGVRYSFFGCDYSLVIPTDNAQEMIFHKLSLVLRFSPSGLL